MEALPNVGDAIRRVSEAYAEALTILTKAMEGLPRPGGEAQRRLAEEWLRVARTGKDGLVAALNQGFEVWERECRRALGALPPGPPATPLEAWADNWRKALDVLATAAKLGDAWSEEARHQAELVQQSIQEGVRAWQQFWPAPERKP